MKPQDQILNSKSGHSINGTVKAITIASDYGGCGHYRMFWPNQVMSAKHPVKRDGTPAYHIDSCTSINFDHMVFYNFVSTVRLQRSASKEHLMFLKDFLMPMSSSRGFKVSVDYDDWFFALPSFNVARAAYPPEVLKMTVQIMRNVHFITVSTTYMKHLMVKHLKIKPERIAVVPNRIPRFLFDGYYEDNFKKQMMKQPKKKPVILWTGSSSHLNLKEPGGTDDLTVIRPLIDSNKYEWVFVGLNKDVVTGKHNFPRNATYVPWADILTYPSVLANLNVDVSLVPLYDCDFNKAKSNIKLLEYGAMAIPAVFQKIEPYKFAPSQATTTDEYSYEIDKIISDKKYKESVIVKQKNILDKHFWLEDYESLSQYKRLYAGNIQSIVGESEKIV